MAVRQVETGRFKAVDDSGNVHTVVELTTYTSFEPVATGVRDEYPGSIEYMLATGEDLNPERDGSFTVVSTDRVLRRR